MSKLFNIDNMNMDGGDGYEMEGGLPSSPLDKDNYDNTINELKKINGEDIINMVKKSSLFIDNIPVKKIINKDVDNITVEDIFKYLKGDSQTARLLLKDLKTLSAPITVSTINSEGTVPASSAEPQAATSAAAPPATTTGNCIHIGIIDETGTFVGVKSVPVSDSSYSVLKGFVKELRGKNQNEIEAASKTGGASIYDKFVKINTGCIPQFIPNYEEKFCNSKELLDLAKIANKNIGPSTTGQSTTGPSESTEEDLERRLAAT